MLTEEELAAAERERKRKRELEPFLKRLRKIDAQTTTARDEIGAAYESLCASFAGWKSKIADERETLKAEALEALQHDGRFREEFLDAFRAFNGEGEPLPNALSQMLASLNREAGVVAGSVERVYLTDRESKGWGQPTVVWQS